MKMAIIVKPIVPAIITERKLAETSGRFTGTLEEGEGNFMGGKDRLPTLTTTIRSTRISHI